MSFNMLEPEEEPCCECWYDETRDRMDREDCPFHWGLTDEPNMSAASVVKNKGPRGAASRRTEDVA